MLYYSHVNEDCQPERTVLQSDNFDTIVCIAGSGERLLSLLDHDGLKEVYVIDNNQDALFLTQTKIVALRELGAEAYLQFVNGSANIATSSSKAKIPALYEKLRHELSAACREYWEVNRTDLFRGIMNAGAFEKFLARVRVVLNLLLGKRFLLRLHNKSFATSKSFPTFRWRLLQFFFRKRWMLRLFGNKDIAFIGEGANIAIIPQSFDQSIRNGSAFNSFMTHLIFRGHLQNMKTEHLPPSMKLEFLDRLCQRLRSGELAIHYIFGDWAKECKNLNLENSTNVFYSASDILSFETIDYVHDFVLESFKKPVRKAIVIRSFLRNQLQANDLDILKSKIPNAGITDLSGLERTEMYKVFAIVDHPEP